MTSIERAKELIASRTTAELLDIWEWTAIVAKNENAPIIRGWLMDEFEKRDFEGFNAWLESDECSDYKLRSYLIKEAR